MLQNFCFLAAGEACAPAPKNIQTATNTAVQPFVLDQARGEEEMAKSALQRQFPTG